MCQGLKLDVSQSYYELRELTLIVEVIEQSHRAEGAQSRDFDNLRADFEWMRGAIDRFAWEQIEAIGSIQQGIHKLSQYELGFVLLGFTGSRSCIGQTSNQPPRPAPQPSPTPTRPYLVPLYNPVLDFLDLSLDQYLRSKILRVAHHTQLLFPRPLPLILFTFQMIKIRHQVILFRSYVLGFIYVGSLESIFYYSILLSFILQ